MEKAPERWSGKVATEHVRRRRGDGGRGRLGAGFTIPTMAIGGIAMLVLSCGDGAVEPTPPPAPVATTVTVSPGSAELSALGETARFTAEVRDQNGQVMAGAVVAWASSDASVATVDASGQVTAAANGSATITATAGSVSGTAAVTVAQVVSSVAVSPAADTLVAFGDTVRLVAEAVDANGHSVAVTEFSWSSSDTLVARVDDSGLVESVAEGEAAVTATASEVTGGAELTVVSPLPTTITVNPDTVALTALGQTAQLAAVVRDQAGRAMEGVRVAWSSGDTTIAEVDSAGLVTAVGVGETTITATSGEASGEAAVTVMQSVGSVVVSPAADTVAQGDTLRLVGEAFDENGHRVEGAVFSWSSSDASVASVDDSGLVTGVTEGTAKITATAGDASGAAEITVAHPDRAALALLYHATRGEGWINNENWLTDAPLGDWYGVETDGSGRVTGLDLEQNGLAGAVPPELARLDLLRDLRLSDNGLTGPIPAELGDLIELWDLSIGQNHLDGPIPPELGNLPSLRSLELSFNQLTGPIPSELGNLSDLEEVGFEANELTGPIPRELGSLSGLRFINLVDNQLTGPIPPELGNLRRLTGLRLGGNQLTGPIPPELGKLAELSMLWLMDNQLTGPIPPELGNLGNLWALWLGSNRLIGPIPPELGKLSAVNGVILSRNMLSGPIPSEIGNLHKLVYMHLNGNELTGPIPRSFLGLQKLEDLLFEYGGTTNRGLCVPATAEFREWARKVAARGNVDRYPSPFCDEIDRQALETLYEATGGADWTRSGGWLEDDDLGEWWGVQTDPVGRVSVLDLADNGLSGHLPEALGRLANLRELRIRGNPLVGRLPVSLASVPLEELDYGGTSLCVADDAEFGEWLNAIPRHSGTGVQCPPLTEREILELLYRNADGPNWSVSAGWLTDAPLAEWHGVETDAAGRVVELGLRRNGLSGSLPAELGQLSNLRRLDLAVNGLSGSIPSELGGLDRLERFDLGRNELDGGIPPELGRLSELRWLFLNWNRLSGSVPLQLGDLGRLEQLSLSGNRLSGGIPKEIGRLGNLRTLDIDRNHLSGPIPPELGGLDRLEWLALSGNQLEGGIPRELGGLAALTGLVLAENRLAGPIPPELGALSLLGRLDLRANDIGGGIPSEIGQLGALESLLLADNRLTGPIPPELGGLARLNEFDLTGNQLSGPVPAELGDLASLVTLNLSGNELSGAIPGELGDLANLVTLNLGSNELSGALPAGLGRAAKLEDLDLRSNALAGPVPSEYGTLTPLKSLILADNVGLAGPMPSAITALGRLERLMAGGTGLCRPADSRFDAWFRTIADRRLARCGGGPSVYLTQTVQSWDDPVPLLAGEAALLRVFVTAPEGRGATMPEVKATFHVNGAERHVVRIPASAQPIPAEIAEGALTSSANAEIPDWLIVPGLEMVIEVDPEGVLDPALGVTKRIPEEGRTAIDVRSVPPFHLTLIPFLHESEPDSSIVESVLAMAEDPHGHELLGDSRTLLPVADFAVMARDPIVTSTKSPWQMIGEVRATRLMEGGTGHWMGIFPESERGSISWPQGLGWIGGQVSVSEPIAGTIAHELGHNLGLRHAPCACAGVDPWFPHPGGRIGAYGYDDGRNELVPPHAADVMSYCRNGVYWISDFFFNKALRHRLASAALEAVAEADPVRTLLVWGGRNDDGVPYLDPAFVVDAVASLPRPGGEYTIDGATSDGTPLFSFGFDMPVNPDAEAQETSFVFALPVQTGWTDLTSITLSGPGGSATLGETTDRPMAILRDPRTGQVRAFLRDPAPETQAVADAVGQGAGRGLEMLFSRGIPHADAWRR